MNRNGKVLIKGLATGLVVTNGMLAVPPYSWRRGSTSCLPM